MWSCRAHTEEDGRAVAAAGESCVVEMGTLGPGKGLAPKTPVPGHLEAEGRNSPLVQGSYVPFSAPLHSPPKTHKINNKIQNIF